MSIKTPRIDKIEQAAFGSEIEVSKIDAPYTTIKNEQGNPRQIADLANNMKVSMGVERVSITKLSKVFNEFGSAGEPVHKTNDDRIRFVGASWMFENTTAGTMPMLPSGTAFNDYVEITFYGTGLNLLSESGVGVSGSASVDGGVYFQFKGDANNVLLSRGYRINLVWPVVKGLALGIHTVRVKKDNTTGTFMVYGCEIINESSQLSINAGKPRLDSRNRELVSQILTDYKSGFDDTSDTLGTKGGRVLVYQNTDGEIKKKLKAVDPAITGNPVAPELITNGTFDTDVSGWSDWGSGLSWHGSGYAQYDYSSDKQAYQVITTVIGKTYQLNVNVNNVTGHVNNLCAIVVRSGPLEGDPLLFDDHILAGGEGDYTYNFTATSTQTQVGFGAGGNISGSIRVDNISVKEVGYNFKALTDTDHSEEEIDRVIHWREFGSNRSDDFNTLGLSNSDRAFTLADGTTTLSGKAVWGSDDNGLLANALNAYFTLTFVGTGLDVDWNTTGITGNLDEVEISVDGVVVGDLTQNNPHGSWRTNRVSKICSGLPYGTHTVQFRISNDNHDRYFNDFTIYKPKKPELESTDIEIADYNIMADYIVGTNGKFNISTGVLRKDATREIRYNGTWGAAWTPTENYINHWQLYSGIAGHYMEYTFFGTGIELRNKAFSGYSTDMQFTINGTPLTAANFPTAIFADYGYDTGFNSATGSLNMRSAAENLGAGFSVSGLPLGVHTVRITNGVAQTMSIEAFDVITPIHVSDTQNGSIGLRDKRVAIDVSEENTKNEIDMGKAKAWINFNAVTKRIESSYNIAAILTVTTGSYKVFFKKPFKDDAYVVTQGGHHGNQEIFDAQHDKNWAWLYLRSNTNSAVDPKWACAVFFGELENEEDIDLGDL